MENVRRLKYISDHFPNKVFNSLYFNFFNKKVVQRLHPLDTDFEGYKKVVEEVIIPDCMEFANDVKGYPERMKTFIKYSHPGYYYYVNFTPELTYKLLTPQEEQTPEKLKHSQILRAVSDMVHTMFIAIDDIVDDGILRHNKKPWFKVCEGGFRCAIYDASVYGYLPFYILKKHFQSIPGYPYMIEKVAEATSRGLIGQNADMYARREVASLDFYHTIIRYKGGFLNCFQIPLGMAYLGILDKNLLDKMWNVSRAIGMLGQVWDDFTDYFYDVSAFGEEPIDIPTGVNNWPSATAIEYFDSKQKQIFEECYGCADPDKVEQVRKLYEEVDLPRRYIEYMRKEYIKLSHQIEEMSDPRLKKVAYSWLDFLIGDVNDVNYQAIK